MLIIYNNRFHYDICMHVHNVFDHASLFCSEAASYYVALAFLKLTLYTKMAWKSSEIFLILPPKF